MQCLIWFVHMVYVATVYNIISLLWHMVCLLLYNIVIAFGVRNTNWVHAAMQWVHAHACQVNGETSEHYYCGAGYIHSHLLITLMQ